MTTRNLLASTGTSTSTSTSTSSRDIASRRTSSRDRLVIGTDVSILTIEPPAVTA